jgi:murein L,D-transpeptidase YcbB/YkuD
VEAVGEDAMSSPKDGGAAQRRSRLEAVAGAASGNAEAGVRQPDAFERIGRYVACAAFTGAFLALVVQVGLQVAMVQMGPPPLQKVVHLLPGFAQHRAAQKSDLAPIVLAPDQVDPRYLAMLFAFEDRRFYSHFGVDPIGIARAARDLILKQRIVSGGSTLTMQVARLLDNQYKRTPSVKLRQIIRAFQLERELSKQQILGLYLALAPFGGRVKGVRAASLRYFGKEPHKLSDAEAALLVALPQAPEARRIDRDADAALRARNFVLKTVTAAGVLTPEEAQRAQLEPVAAESAPMPPNPEMKPVFKPAASVAALFTGLTLGLNFVAPATAAPIEPPAAPAFMSSEQPLLLSVRRKLLAPLPDGTTQADRDGLWMFYAARTEPVWVGKTGWTPKAVAAIEEIKRADDWGLQASAFEIPVLAAQPPPAENDLANAELGLSLAALKYARHARGGRMEDPASQLSSYLDRKPTLRHPLLVMEQLAASNVPGEYLRTLHPQHPQFEKLRQQYLARRDGSAHTSVAIPTKGSKLYPGTTHKDIALVRERLGVHAVDGGVEVYDEELAAVVQAFQEKRDISPANGVINAKTRRALNEGKQASPSTLLANMEQWRWMPQDLGETYVWVNVPEFTVSVIDHGQVVHSERVIVGELDKQTPIFSQDLKTIYFHPRWNVPESIKVKEILPSLARGGGYFYRQGMKLVRNGREVKASSVNWGNADIRNYDVYQPSGPGNALGRMKFTFPNKHSVYMHDTQSKGLFGASQRTFSHGCVRVKNPQRLAETLLGIDKGWSAKEVDELLDGNPEEVGVPLNQHIPVHITYFTAQVDDNGEVTTENDVYGHEKRITQALEGKWDSIDKGSDHLAQVELAQRLNDAESTGRANARRSGRRVVSRGYIDGGGGDSQRVVSRGSSANDIFRQSFGY